MRINIITLCLLFCFLSCTQNNESKKKSLKVAVQQFNKAFMMGDVATLESMITENYLHTNGQSQVIKKENWINYLKKRKGQLDSGELKLIGYVMDQSNIEIHGNTAIVTGKVEAVTKKNDSIKEEHAYRVTHLWVLEGDQWKRAGFHDTKIY